MRTEKEIRDKIIEIEKMIKDIYEPLEDDIVLDTLRWVLGEIEFDDILEK
jgi:hypothetical protein